ncbi:MAG: PAAR domain-containing protein [Polyangiaceae bacterium]
MANILAKKGDRVSGTDTHIVLVEGNPIPMSLPFNGTITQGLASSVYCDDQAVAIVGSQADNVPHVAPGGTFQTQPSNKGKVSSGSSCVFIEGPGAARANDPVSCCNDPTDADTGKVVASGTVFVG